MCWLTEGIRKQQPTLRTCSSSIVLFSASCTGAHYRRHASSGMQKQAEVGSADLQLLDHKHQPVLHSWRHHAAHGTVSRKQQVQSRRFPTCSSLSVLFSASCIALTTVSASASSLTALPTAFMASAASCNKKERLLSKTVHQAKIIRRPPSSCRARAAPQTCTCGCL